MTPAPLDASDVDLLDDLEQNQGYALVTRRIAAEIERKRNELEQDADLYNTARLRGYVAGLRLSLNTPQNLRAEIARNVKEKHE